MTRLKLAQILFFLGALSFISRPFLGFAIFDKQHHPVEDSILVKIFSKRKPELLEDSNSSFSAIEKKLAGGGLAISPGFNAFLCRLFPAAFAAPVNVSVRALRALQPPPAGRGWLLYNKIVI